MSSRQTAFAPVLVLVLVGAGTGAGSATLRRPRADLAWVAIDSPVTGTHRNSHACAWDHVHDMIYLYGGSSDFSDTAVRNLQRYDANRDTWTDLAPMNTPRRLIKGLYCRGRIYALGGDSLRVTLSSCEAYDIAANAWQPIAPLPGPLCGYQAVVWRDSLIYVMGGRDAQRGTRKVWIYAPLADTWLAGDSLPVAIHQGDACLLDNTIYFAGGLLPDMYDTAMTIGVIDPDAPQRIEWNRGPTLPYARYNGPVVARQGKVCWFGGATSLPSGYTNEVYQYDPETREMSRLPDLPRQVTGGCLGLARDNIAAVYSLAGDQGHAPKEPAGYYRLSEHGDHDVAPLRIEAPVAAIDSWDTVMPVAIVRNFGAYPEGFPVVLRIGLGYVARDSLHLAAGESLTLSFAPWVADARGRVIVTCSTRLVDDDQPDNDAVQETCEVYAFNAGLSGVYLPSWFVAGPFTPQLTVVNYGPVPGEAAISWRIFRYDTIPAYAEVESCYLEGRASVRIAFPVWQARPGYYLAKIFVTHEQRLLGDTTFKHFHVIPSAIGEDTSCAVVRGTTEPTVLKGVVRMPIAATREQRSTACLLDVSGREVRNLHPGENDVSRLAPGVYFVAEQLKPKPQAQAIRKVVLTE